MNQGNLLNKHKRCSARHAELVSASPQRPPILFFFSLAERIRGDAETSSA